MGECLNFMSFKKNALLHGNVLVGGGEQYFFEISTMTFYIL